MSLFLVLFLFWIPSLLLKEVGTSLGTHVIINKVQTNRTISNIWNNILFYFVAGRTFTLIMLYVEAMDFWDEPLNCVPATKSTQNVTSVYILKLKCHRKLQKTFLIKDWPSRTNPNLMTQYHNQVRNQSWHLLTFIYKPRFTTFRCCWYSRNEKNVVVWNSVLDLESKSFEQRL